MKKSEYVIWFLMVSLALMQSEGKVQCLVFEVALYFLCKKIINRIINPKKKKEKNQKLYKYENLDKEQIPRLEQKEKFNIENYREDIEEARIRIQEKEDRIAGYDFREFEGRQNVQWEDVYDYLWLQCRYKGIPMWNEYINELINRGCLNESDRKKIFKKAGKYIPWEYRPDLEEEQNEFRKEVRKKDKEYDDFNKAYDIEDFFEEKGLFNDGLERIFSKEDKKINKSDSYLKSFEYDEYLKRKGYI